MSNDLVLIQNINVNVGEYEFPKILNDIKYELEEAKKELYSTPAYQRVNMLEKQIKSYEESRANFEQYLIDSIGVGNIVETENHFVSVKKGKKTSAVTVLDIEAVPSEFVKITKTVDKVEVGKVLRKGGVVPGLELSEGEGKPQLVIERKEFEIIHAE